MGKLYTSQTPNFPNETDNTYDLGTEVFVSRDCYVVGGGRYGATATPSNLTPVHHHLWTTGGSKLAEVQYGAHVPGAWQYARYAAPVFLAAGTHVVSAYGPTNTYVAFTALHAGALTNGDITAPAQGSGTGPTGRFTTSTAIAFPDQSGGGNGYGADILIGDLKTGEVSSLFTGARVDVRGYATGAVEPPVSTVSGWDTLRGIYEEAAGLAMLDAERERDPIDCPSCGWPLSTDPRGVRYCPHGDYRRS